jgi:hypothetical protein
MKAELRSQRTSGAAESVIEDGRETAHESQPGKCSGLFLSLLCLFAAIPLALILPAIWSPPSLPAIAGTATTGQTMINLVKYESFGQDDNQIQSKYFKMNDLQIKQPAGASNPVKLNQTSFMPVRPALLNS